MDLSPEQRILKDTGEELQADGIDLNPPVIYSGGVLHDAIDIHNSIYLNVRYHGLTGEQLQKAVDFVNYIRTLSYEEARAVIAELPIERTIARGTYLIMPRPEFNDDET